MNTALRGISTKISTLRTSKLASGCLAPINLKPCSYQGLTWRQLLRIIVAQKWICLSAESARGPGSADTNVCWVGAIGCRITAASSSIPMFKERRQQQRSVATFLKTVHPKIKMSTLTCETKDLSTPGSYTVGKAPRASERLSPRRRWCCIMHTNTCWRVVGAADAGVRRMRVSHALDVAVLGLFVQLTAQRRSVAEDEI